MQKRNKNLPLTLLIAAALAGCGGGSSDTVALASNITSNDSSLPSSAGTSNTPTGFTPTLQADINTSPSAVASSTAQSTPNAQMS